MISKRADGFCRIGFAGQLASVPRPDADSSDGASHVSVQDQIPTDVTISKSDHVGCTAKN